ncbi:MAG: WecB/TagA/CpsF family glycosyltransferase [Ruminococcaceae bacterium]|nr:WecB/TagA/CpsF family glycosyltransferase [Oscillospiraceae bacterium]
MSDRINIRGVNFCSISLPGAVETLMSYLKEGKQAALYTPNSEIVQMCIDSPELYDVINSAEVIVPDGIGVVKAGKILGTPFEHGKVAGIEVGEKLIEALAGTDYTVFFLGGKPGVAEAAVEKLSEKYPGVKIIGCTDGYFKKEGAENDKIIEKINESGADVLYVCLGAPAQEKWIFANRSRLTNVKLLLALGGSLDGYSGNVKRAPKVFIDLGLEWFYRLICDPKRIGRMMSLPKFYFGTIKHKLTNK